MLKELLQQYSENYLLKKHKLYQEIKKALNLYL
jgi:hypothetical protein